MSSSRVGLPVSLPSALAKALFPGVRSAHSVKIKQLSRRLGLLWPVRWFARPRVDDSSVSDRPPPRRRSGQPHATSGLPLPPPAMLHFIPDSLNRCVNTTLHPASVTPLPIGKPLRLYSLYFISALVHPQITVRFCCTPSLPLSSDSSSRSIAPPSPAHAALHAPHHAAGVASAVPRRIAASLR